MYHSHLANSNRMKKYQNPHNNHDSESLGTVSRRDLARDLDGQGSNSETENNPMSSEATDALDTLLSTLSTEFVGAIKSRKRKRSDSSLCIVNRNSAAGGLKYLDFFPFYIYFVTGEIRLLSWKPAVVITSELVDGWPSQPKMYPQEDTTEEAEERRRRAKQVAVDFERIKKQSTIPYPSFKVAANTKYKVERISTPQTIAIVECPKPKQSRPLHLRTGPGQLKSREPKTRQTLIVSARSGHAPPPYPRSESLVHTFYHSDNTVGGKSAGYGWGYRGSSPRPAGMSGSSCSGYSRDNMRKGVDMAVVDREVGTTQGTRAKSSKIR
ncbi:unnamed protein product [Rhizoctonia solani]|uniref:Uncharacterized protein n=1 Tax=Rhizoctonia solani TaxID=456999 RepID=A0A8H2WKX0_9AGAM|nr:unnamed protein product [Rhizoctonia solani]